MNSKALKGSVKNQALLSLYWKSDIAIFVLKIWHWYLCIENLTLLSLYWKSDIAIFVLKITWNYANSPFNPVSFVFRRGGIDNVRLFLDDTFIRRDNLLILDFSLAMEQVIKDISSIYIQKTILESSNLV